MQGLLATLVDELRSVGIGVSVGEHLDAAEALSRISLFDKDVVRAALLSTLVKRAEHVETFNLVFELVMASPGGGEDSLVEAMSDDQLSDTLRHAVGAGDRPLMRLLADEYVRRFGGLEAGRPVAGVFANIAVNQAADLEGVRASLLESGESPVQAEGFGGSGGGSGSGAGSGSGSAGFRARLADARADRGVTDVRAELRAAVRRALVADRGAQAVRETMRVELPEDMDIVTASAAEQRAMAAVIGPLAQRLTYVLARLAVRRRTLSIRRTMQRAMGTGGAPFRLVTEPARPPRPEIVVLADMSGSVAAFSRFTLDLLVALDSRLNRLRVFSFVDGVADITELVREARGAGRRLSAREAARDAVRWSGSSDYGYVMREVAREFAPRLTRRSVVLVVGDARSNYGDPRVEAFRDICERAGRVYWLNPEPRRFWNEGDSVIGRYAPLCAQVRECRTLRQIADFVESLTIGSGGTSPEGRMR
jgi:uncharacterized protein with von Willebrand factor type A (vWA) domain